MDQATLRGPIGALLYIYVSWWALSSLCTFFCACTEKGSVLCLPGSGAYNELCSSVSVAILGMHTLMSNQQYYEALGSSTIVNKEGLNSK